MELYDTLIEEVLTLTQHAESQPCSKETWKQTEGFELVMKQDMAYELGSGSLPAVSGLFFTSNERLVSEDQVLLLGPDLPWLAADSPYARITLLKVAAGSFAGEDEDYERLRKIEYTRYHIFPAGYMMRISAAGMREPVRVAKKALQKGLSFEKIGRLFIEGYHANPDVEHASVLFITQPDFPYEKLETLAKKGEQITSSLHQIFDNLIMDCNGCSLKPVCDEVEGLRSLHFQAAKSIEKSL